MNSAKILWIEDGFLGVQQRANPWTPPKVPKRCKFVNYQNGKVAETPTSDNKCQISCWETVFWGGWKYLATLGGTCPICVWLKGVFSEPTLLTSEPAIANVPLIAGELHTEWKCSMLLIQLGFPLKFLEIWAGITHIYRHCIYVYIYIHTVTYKYVWLSCGRCT